MNVDDIAKPEPKRDRYGRYLIAGTAHTRATTITKTLSDTYGLGKWQQRMVAVGIGSRKDLHALAATLNPTDDKNALDKVCGDAMAAASASSGANIGTALHKATDIVDAGGDMPDLPGDLSDRIRLYQDTVAKAGVKFDRRYIEQILTIPDWNGDGTAPPIAGTTDRGLVELADGRKVIGDLKTGRDLSYAWQEIAMQLAIYANHDHTYDPATDKLGPKIGGIDQNVGLVIWLPSTGNPRCHLYLVDIKQGAEAVDYALWVRSWRKTKGLAEEYMPLNLPADIPAGNAAKPEWLRGRIKALAGSPEAAGMLIELWPASISKPLPEKLTRVQTEEMQKVLDQVEAKFEIPFGATEPGAQLTRKKSSRQAA